MLRLIVGGLLLVPSLAVIALVLLLDDAPRSEGSGETGSEPPRPAPSGPAAPATDPAGIVNVQATIELPPQYPGRYLNVDLDAERAVRDGTPVIRRIAVGDVDVSGWLAQQAMQWALDEWSFLDKDHLLLAAGRALESYPERLDLVCVWPRTPVERLRVRAGAAGDRGRPGAYAERIAGWAAGAPGSRAPLRELLRSLLAEAAERTAAGADPVVENRTAVLLAAAQAFGCAPAADGGPGRRVRPVLHRRHDLGRHFAGSAALAALLGREASESIGMDKEIRDTGGWSGFSFSDVAANRAGAIFGELATASARSARRVQERIERAVSDADIMPAVRHLPDHLPEEELKRRFGEPGGRAYQQVLEGIEAQIADVPLYRVSK